MAKADQDVDANGQVLPIGSSTELEFLASYDPDCKLIKTISLATFLNTTLLVVGKI